MSTSSQASPRYLSIKRTLEKLCKQKSFLYSIQKSDPTFPRKVVIGKTPAFIEQDIDAWVMENTKRAAVPRKPVVEFWKHRKDLKKSAAA